MLPLGTAYVDDGDKCEDDGPRDDDAPNDDDVLRDIRDDGDSNEPKTLRMGTRVSVCLHNHTSLCWQHLNTICINVFWNTSTLTSKLSFRCHAVAETYEQLK